jgi:hypothetical protein
MCGYYTIYHFSLNKKKFLEVLSSMHTLLVYKTIALVQTHKMYKSF